MVSIRKKIQSKGRLFSQLNDFVNDVTFADDASRGHLMVIFINCRTVERALTAKRMVAIQQPKRIRRMFK